MGAPVITVGFPFRFLLPLLPKGILGPSGVNWIDGGWEGYGEGSGRGGLDGFCWCMGYGDGDGERDGVWTDEGFDRECVRRQETT